MEIDMGKENMTNKNDHTFELRSEKVRSIVGQIPSSLVRYGITVIGAVLACLFAVAYFLPYKQVCPGTAIIHAVRSDNMSDSTETTILLKFENKRPDDAEGLTIRLQSAGGTIDGTLLHLSSIRDTLGQQEALCRFNTDELKTAEHQSMDFLIVQSSSNILRKMFGGRH